MKRICRAFAVLLALTLLAGCKQPEVADKTVTCGDSIIELAK